jgi:hypothetical protein
LIDDERPGDTTTEILRSSAMMLGERRDSVRMFREMQDTGGFQGGLSSEPGPAEAEELLNMVRRENRLLFRHAKLISRVRKKWMSREAPSVTDQGRWDREFLSHYPNAPAAAYIQRSAVTQSFFHSDHGGWLQWFAMDRVHVPLEQVDMHLFECGISVSHRTDMVAILQEVLEAAGYVFRNLVPLWMVSEPSRSVDHATVSKFATDGMTLLQAEIVEWRRYVTAMRHTPQGQAFDAARAEFEAARTRPRPTFSISSLSGEGSMHDVEGPLFELSMSVLKKLKLPRALRDL